jgi:hypothetical protein
VDLTRRCDACGHELDSMEPASIVGGRGLCWTCAAKAASRAARRRFILAEVAVGLLVGGAILLWGFGGGARDVGVIALVAAVVCGLASAIFRPKRT